MNSKKNIIHANLLISFFLFANVGLLIHASDTYYFSNQGDNANNGFTRQAPWKTLDKIQEISLQPGDSVLFQRGDVFYGSVVVDQSGTPGNPIYFGSYGTGDRPLLAGSLDSLHVEAQNDTFYKFSSERQVKGLYINNVLFYPSRYPNTGFLRVAKNDEKGILTGQNLDQPDGYWDGATIVFRPVDWLYDWEVVDSFRKNTFYFDSTYQRNTNRSGYGYFLMNKQEELDIPGEYFYNTVNDTCTFIPFEGFSEINDSIEAVVSDYGIYLSDSVKHVSVKGLQFKYYHRSGVYGIEANENILVDSCHFQHLGEAGVRFRNKAKNCTISNNIALDIHGRGFSISNSSGCAIVSNTIKRIGFYPGFGTPNVNGMSGIIVEAFDESSSTDHDLTVFKSDSNYVAYNTIDSCGYIGIRLEGDYNVGEKNIIRYPVLKLSDGGGIYFWKHTMNTIVRNNFVFNAEGNNESTSANYPAIASGIYFDGSSSACSCIENTVVNCGGGIGLNAKTFEHVAIGNVSYGNFRQLVTPTPSYELDKNYIIKHNKLYCTSGDQYCYTFMLRNVDRDFGTLDSNYYFNPYRSYIINEIWSGSSTYNLNQWQSISGEDMHSHESFFDEDQSGMFTPRLFHNFTDHDTTIVLTGVFLNMDSTRVSQLELSPYTSDIVFEVDTGFVFQSLHAENQRDNDAYIYPNPAKSHVHIVLPDSEIKTGYVNVSVYSNEGEKIYHENVEITGNTAVIKTGMFPGGVYFIRSRSCLNVYTNKLVISD